VCACSIRAVGSQVYLEDELTARATLADKQLTGTGGAFDRNEAKRAFLQYDFPGFATGEVTKVRRAGGGAVRERAAVGSGLVASACFSTTRCESLARRALTKPMTSLG